MPTAIENNFIRTWRKHSATLTAKGRGMTSEHSARTFEIIEQSVRVHGLAERVNPPAPGEYMALHRQPLKLTPRGLDLLATADAINYDPDEKAEPVAKQPATMPCTDCKGRGRVPLSELQGTQDRSMKELVEGPDGRRSTQVEREEPVLLAGWDVTCTTCKGLKVVPAVHPPAFVDRFIDYQPLPLRWHSPRGVPYSSAELLRISDEWRGAAVTPAASEQANEWISLTDSASVKSLIGQTVEIEHRDGTPHRLSPAKVIEAGELALIVIHWGRHVSLLKGGDWRLRVKPTAVPKPYSDHPIYALAVHLHAGAKTRALADTKISIGPGGTKLESAEASDGWISFDTYADVEGLEGKEVDVRHLDGDAHDSGHIREVGGSQYQPWIEFEITGRSFSGGIGWEIRPHCAGAL